ncbi:hypothetical protein BDU57DRAFT_516036 [Ampelomyces quisqualis]|uniref:Myb-like DNA-binding domain-containing protein n=1 Tax=Ampelomyces quisqualis TaxID=50730 RepID=A0A6A5QK84_AMPQU|nr:hypothetical protein BDU57DRAFT_516036 [Ampelomyces quisqualis]
MGQNSSQQVPPSPKPEGGMSISQVSPAAQCPRYSPSADDVQASQQLLAEEAQAHAEHDPDHSRGKNGTHGQNILTPPSTINMSPVSSHQTLPSRRQSRPLSVPSPSCEVEVPDSQQFATPRRPSREPFTAEPTSSLAIPASVQEKETTVSKKRGARKSSFSDNFLEQDTSRDRENTVAGAIETPQTKPKRRKSYLTPPQPPPLLTPSSKWADHMTVQEMLTMDLDSDAIEGAPLGKQRSRRKRVARKSNKKSLSVLSGDDEVRETVFNDFGSMCPPHAKAKLRRLKRSKSSEMRHTEPEGDEDQTMSATDESKPYQERPATPEDSDSPSMDTRTEMRPEHDRSVTPEEKESPLMDGVAEVQPSQNQSANPKKRKSLSRGKVAEGQLHAPLPARQPRNSLGRAHSTHLEPVETQTTSKKRKRTKPSDNRLSGQIAASRTSPVKDNIPEVGPKPKRFHKPVPVGARMPGRRYTRKSIVDTSVTAAERELDKSYTLNYPPVLPDSGPFSPDEDEILRRAIMSYQHGNNLDINQLVDIIQWTSPSYDPVRPLKKSEWHPGDQENAECSKELWDQLRETEPKLKRSLTAIKGHVQARYHAYKSGGWTEEEDEHLRQLVKDFPNGWKQISLVLEDRSPLDIQNRWKDYVQFGNKRNTSRWSLEEETQLLQALSVVIREDHDQREIAGLPLLAEYSTRDVKWPKVCDLMGNIRSRLQCQNHWRLMKTRDASAYIDPKAKKRAQSRKSEPGIAQMRWGDKADVVDALAVCDGINKEEDIDWDRVSMQMENNWSVDTLQTALREVLGLVEDEGSFMEKIKSVSHHLLEHVSHDELREHYDPLAVDVERKGKEKRKQNKKRKRSSGRDVSLAKRTRRESLGNVLAKSSAFVTESDDASD